MRASSHLVCGTQPEADIREDDGSLLTPEWFGIPPRKRPFTPSELAPYLAVCPMTIVRMIKDGHLRALKLPGKRGYKIPYRAIVDFFLEQQGADN